MRADLSFGHLCLKHQDVSVELQRFWNFEAEYIVWFEWNENICSLYLCQISSLLNVHRHTTSISLNYNCSFL